MLNGYWIEQIGDFGTGQCVYYTWMNSVHEGLYYGVPEVVIPHQLEQHLNGLQVVRHNAGVMIGDKHPYANVTMQQIRTALKTIMDDSQYQQNADRIGQTLREAGGYMAAVDEIEGFIVAQTVPNAEPLSV